MLHYLHCLHYLHLPTFFKKALTFWKKAFTFLPTVTWQEETVKNVYTCKQRCMKIYVLAPSATLTLVQAVQVVQHFSRFKNKDKMTCP